MKVGDYVTRKSVAMSGDFRNSIYLTGEVIFVHPKGRFFVLEAQLPGGKVREAFRQ